MKNTFLLLVLVLQSAWVVGCGSMSSANGTVLAPLPVVPVFVSTSVTATKNPQVASYLVTTQRVDAKVTVDFGLDTNYGLQTWTQPVSATSQGNQFNMLVAGMRAFTTYHMRARVDFSDGSQWLDADHTFTTQGLPTARVPQLTVTQPAGFQPNPGIELFDVAQFGGIPPTAPVTAFASDLKGNIIWYDDLQDGTQLDYPFPFKLLPDGNFLIVIAGLSNSIGEINLAGDTIWQLSLTDLDTSLAAAGFTLTPSSFHHDILPLPNGHIIVLASEQKTFNNLPGLPGATQVIGDALIDLDENRKPVWTWSTFDHLDINRQPLGFPDWTHSNALIYSPDDGNLILSIRNQNWVIKINYKDSDGDGGIVWRLGPGGDFTIPNGTPADYNYAQHYPVLIGPVKSGVFPLMMFDNGNNRLINGMVCDSSGAASCYSRPVIFQLDEVAKTAQIQWQDKLPAFSSCCGNVNILDNGNVEYDIAILTGAPQVSRIQEVTFDPISPQLVWQMDLTGQLAYRAFRIPSLYPGVTWTQMP